MLIDLQNVLHSLGLVASLTKPTPKATEGNPTTALAALGGLFAGSAPSDTYVPPVLSLAVSDGKLVLQTPPTEEPQHSSSQPQRFLTLASINSSDTLGTLAATTDAAPLDSEANNQNETSQDTEAGGYLPFLSTLAGTDSSGCSFTPYSPAPVPLEQFAEWDPSVAMVYRYRQQQSVNLGSWFVQEQWMNPSLFTCAAGAQQAELDVAQGWGGVSNARQVLERHWDEWITESDFKYLASIGINTVRLPIGYWNLGPVYCEGTVFEPVSDVYANSWPRVVRAINWAAKYGLGVLVDLHGAPGSQNGQAHGGTSDGQQNLFNSDNNMQLTVNILTYLTQQFVKVNNVVGIELLNEPTNVDILPAFYTSTLETLRQVSHEAATFPFYINDAYDLSRFADYISTRHDFVVLDHHSYFVFDDNSQNTPASQLTMSLAPGQGSLSEQLAAVANEGRRNLVIDEWSCALSSQSLSNASDPAEARRDFCTGQMESYANATAGWSFWSLKTENCDDDDNWCFVHAVGNSLPSTFFSYPNISLGNLSLEEPASAPLNPDQAYLTFGTTMPLGSGFDSSMADEWLASMGTQNNLAQINEALAEAPISKPVNRRSVDYLDIGERAFLFSSTLHHRFTARHHRHRAREHRRRDQSKVELTPEQAAISRGYSDGWSAAKTFAAMSGSRLGFTGQFMTDALASMGGQIVRGDEQYYKSWFLKGLADGEMQVIREMAAA